MGQQELSHTSREGLGPPTHPGKAGSEASGEVGTATNPGHREASRSRTHSSCSSPDSNPVSSDLFSLDPIAWDWTERT